MHALILVDIQNDFLPGGALAVPRGDEVIGPANRLIPEFELVVATQDWHPADHQSFARSHRGRTVGERIELGGLPQVLWPAHCVQNTPGAEFAPGLNLAAIQHVVRKGTDPEIDSYSGFFDNGQRKATGLHAFLRERDVDSVTILGLATDYCVKATALDARKLGLRTVVAIDGCRGVALAPGDVERAVEEMRSAGVEIMMVEEVMERRNRTSEDISPTIEPPVEELARGRFLRLVRRGRWEYVDRVNTSGAAMIVALTPERHLLLTEQYRVPLGRPVIELPAGLIGDDPGTDGEHAAEAARRELLEETGYDAATMELLAAGPSSAGLATEQVAIYLAGDLRWKNAGGGTEHEAITVHKVPLAEAPQWLKERQEHGILVDPRIYAALYFLEARANRRTQGA